MLEYRARGTQDHFRIRARDLHPIVDEYDIDAGTASGHYFHQDIWAARKIYARRPARHVDVGSRIDGFIAHLLVFMDVEVVDVRRLRSTMDGLRFVQGDGTRMGPFADGSLESISSLHAIEHFGLGRYGDPIDPNAYQTAIHSLVRVLRPGGHLYLSVPIGAERLEFNAQRVFAPQTVLDSSSALRLLSFSAVDDEGNLVPDCDPQMFRGAQYACGLFEFTKPY
jgi:SAM-dependent methyltransferase